MAAIVHDLKCVPPHYEKVANGTKPFEVRLDDRDFHVGDVLLLREWVPNSGYTGRETLAHISSKLKESAYVKDDYCVLGLDWVKALS